MSPDKGVDTAIEVARRAGRPLLIAAKMWEPDEVRFHDEVVRPLLGDGVTYVGPVAGPAKDALLEGAVALLDPLRWPEPFGLVMVEAMARGTPVLAFPQGAAAEIVDPGITGFHCRDGAHMAALVDRAAALDRRACRRRAEDRFGARRMVAAHVALYRRLLDTGTPGSAPVSAGAV
ncbi:glycosyltransferase [Actinomarinicola tropica]|uniref:Glycosyltransferase n=1 Tax=Actinomarinicola tropica TaxID=2789776 RepID=A0A5Q2RQC9_9ACTN|nr:glycosyltransferase [Actinomarinicola tropica]QGG95405.1 glycosyltransferase [Actinomarinicola tropica]